MYLANFSLEEDEIERSYFSHRLPMYERNRSFY